MGGINFAWLAVWVLSPDWPSRKLHVCEFFRRLGEAAAPGGGECGPCPTLHPIPWHLLYNWGKSRKTSVSVAERRSTDPNAIRLFDLAIAGDDLAWPAAPGHPWLSRQATGSTLGQRKYLLSCRTRGLPTSTNFESKLPFRFNPPFPRISEDIVGVFDRMSKKNRRLDFLLQFAVFSYGCNLLNKDFF